MQALQLPPISHKKIAAAAAEYQKHAAELRTLTAAARDLGAQREAATRADREALARAIREGKRDAGSAQVDRLEGELTKARRRIEALDLAVEAAQHDLGQAVERYRTEWLAEIEQRAAHERDDLRQAIERVRHAQAQLATTQSITGWASGFPTRAKLATGSARVPGLSSPNGDPPTVEHIIGALLELTEPPRPKLTLPTPGTASLRRTG